MKIYDILKETGIPVAYFKFDEPQKLPFVVYKGDGQENFKADDNIYTSENSYKVDLYFEKKDEELEKKIENLFIENEIIYEKTEDIYIDSEDIYMISYYV